MIERPVVVLPHPDSPTIPKHSPSLTSKEILLTALFFCLCNPEPKKKNCFKFLTERIISLSNNSSLVLIPLLIRYFLANFLYGLRFSSSASTSRLSAFFASSWVSSNLIPNSTESLLLSN